jgi:hypothetical protein
MRRRPSARAIALFAFVATGGCELVAGVRDVELASSDPDGTVAVDAGDAAPDTVEGASPTDGAADAGEVGTDARGVDAGAGDATTDMGAADAADAARVDAGGPDGANDGAYLPDATPTGTTWFPQNEGLFGGNVKDVIPHPTDASIAYALSAGPLYKTIDHGAHWSAFDSSAVPFGADAFAIDPSNGATAYVVALSGFYATSNGGAQWNRIQPTSIPGNVVAVDPSNGKTIYAGVYRAGLQKTTDSGLHWAKCGDGPTDLDSVVIGAGVVVASGSNGVYQSNNGCTAWTASSVPSASFPNPRRLAVDRTRGLFYYVDGVASTEGVFTSVDGLAWTNRHPVTSVRFDSIAVDATSGSAYAVGSAATTSANQGTSWMSFALPPFPSSQKTIAVGAAGDLWLALSNAGVYNSANQGGSFQAATTGIAAVDVAFFAFDPTTPGTLYAAAPEGSVWKTTTAGQAWTRLYATDGNVRGLAYHPASSALYMIDPSDQVEVTTDGMSWTPLTLGGKSLAAGSLALDPVTGDLLITASPSGASELVRLHGGTLTVEGSIGTNVVATNLRVATDGTMVVLANGAPLGSKNGGMSWSPLFSQNCTSIAIDPRDAQTVFCATVTTLLRTRNFGTSSIDLGHATRIVEVDPKNGNVYSGASDFSVSIDHGDNWASSPSGWPQFVQVQALGIDPNSSGVLYAGFDGAGVYATLTGGL